MTHKELRASLVKYAKEMENEVIKPLYKTLLKSGWTLGQIDEMDIHFYFSLGKEEQVYIDQVELL